MKQGLPPCGVSYWPVGTGDSTTISVDEGTVVQVDINHLESAEEEKEPVWPVVDELVARLPTNNGHPQLAAFALTHPDQDHSRGFKKLLEAVEIGELWFTPRIFLEYTKELCDDALVFRKEAVRRIKATIDAGIRDPGHGNRVRLFGASDLLEQDDFKGFPEDRLIIPGNAFTTINELDLAGTFKAFVHAPFKDDSEGDRNDTSLALQITLQRDEAKLQLLLFGDLSYPILKKIFERSKSEDLAWNLLLTPHHCSKSAMYWKNQEEESETLRRDIVEAMAEASQIPNYIIASSRPVPTTDQEGANPPHAKAKRQYEQITETFLCTMEYPNEESPEPLMFAVAGKGFEFRGKVPVTASAGELARRARGTNEPPAEPTTYGIEI